MKRGVFIILIILLIALALYSPSNNLTKLGCDLFPQQQKTDEQQQTCTLKGKSGVITEYPAEIPSLFYYENILTTRVDNNIVGGWKINVGRDGAIIYFPFLPNPGDHNRKSHYPQTEASTEHCKYYSFSYERDKNTLSYYFSLDMEESQKKGTCYYSIGKMKDDLPIIFGMGGQPLSQEVYQNILNAQEIRLAFIPLQQICSNEIPSVTDISACPEQQLCNIEITQGPLEHYVFGFEKDNCGNRLITFLNEGKPTEMLPLDIDEAAEKWVNECEVKYAGAKQCIICHLKDNQECSSECTSQPIKGEENDAIQFGEQSVCQPPEATLESLERTCTQFCEQLSGIDHQAYVKSTFDVIHPAPIFEGKEDIGLTVYLDIKGWDKEKKRAEELDLTYVVEGLHVDTPIGYAEPSTFFSARADLSKDLNGEHQLVDHDIRGKVDHYRGPFSENKYLRMDALPLGSYFDILMHYTKVYEGTIKNNLPDHDVTLPVPYKITETLTFKFLKKEALPEPYKTYLETNQDYFLVERFIVAATEPDSVRSLPEDKQYAILVTDHVEIRRLSDNWLIWEETRRSFYNPTITVYYGRSGGSDIYYAPIPDQAIPWKKIISSIINAKNSKSMRTDKVIQTKDGTVYIDANPDNVYSAPETYGIGDIEALLQCLISQED